MIALIAVWKEGARLFMEVSMDEIVLAMFHLVILQIYLS
jgi:hypothetical protein